MSSLTTDRIRASATRLGLTHLTEVVTDLVERAEAGQMGYLDFVDLLLEEELGLREKAAGSATRLKLSGLPAPQDPRPVRLRLPARPRCLARSATWQPSSS